MLECIYIFAWVICIASKSCLICLSSKREKGLWTQIGPNSPPVLTKAHTRGGFCGRGAPRYGGTFVYKEGATGISGAVGGEPSWGGAPSFGCLCLTSFA